MPAGAAPLRPGVVRAERLDGAAAGDRILYEHDEANDAEELYLVHAGRATFELDGDSGRRSRRHVRVRPAGREADGVRRGARHDDSRHRRPAGRGLAAGRVGAVGARHAALRGRQVREAADRSRELAEANPGLPMLRYMLACCELQAGRPAEAIEQLEAALVTPRMRAIAGKDPTLDPIRGESAFKALLAP